METIGAPELIIILVVVVLLFGSSKLPKLARSLGQASKEFKKGIEEGAADTMTVPQSAPATPAPLDAGSPVGLRDTTEFSATSDR